KMVSDTFCLKNGVRHHFCLGSPTMSGWIIAVAFAAVAALLAIGRARETARAGEIRTRLSRSARASARRRVDFPKLDGLPAPVARYLRQALTDGQPLIRTATLRQSGTLRTEPEGSRWLPFSARHFAVPAAVGFVWDAMVELPLGLHVRVLDSFV